MDFGIKIAKQFKKVYYWTPSLESDFADIKDALLGSGLEDEGLHRIILNWGDIMWFGSHGILKEPEYKYKYGMLARIYCTWAGKHWEQINFDDDIDEVIAQGKKIGIQF